MEHFTIACTTPRCRARPAPNDYPSGEDHGAPLEGAHEPSLTPPSATMETSSKVMAANMALDTEIAVVGLRGEVWLAERLSWGDESGGEGERAQQPRFRRRLIGDFELPSANIPMHVEIVTVNGETFVLAGVLRQTQRALKLWHLAKTTNVTSGNSADDSHQNGCTPREIELEKPRDGKLRGFGCVMPLPNTLKADVESKTYKLRLGCGLGIGKAHIWDLEIDLAQHSANQRHIGSVMGRRNSISAMCFAARKLVTVAALDELIQVWSIVELYEQHDENNANETNGGSAAPPQGFNASSKLGAVHSVEDLARLMPNDALARLRAEHANFNQVQAKSFAEELAALPPCAHRPLWLLAIPTGVDLEPEKKHGAKPTDEATVPISEFVNLVAGLGDYEGDLDAEWSPHGFGSQTVSSSRDRELSYQGDWVHGRREGQGQLRDESTGQVIYKGQWHCDRKHGDGHEIRRGEEYTGRFCKDQRHGFGTMRLTKSQRSTGDGAGKSKVRGRVDAASAAGRSVHSREAGEIYSGFWREGKMHGIGRWLFPARCKSLNAASPDALLPLGKIRCTVAHNDGNLLREFLFVRDDGQVLAHDDRALLECGTSMTRNAAFSLPGAYALDEDGNWRSCDICWACTTKLRDGGLQCPSCQFRIHEKAACCSLINHSGPDQNSVPSCPFPSCQGKALEPVTEESARGPWTFTNVVQKSQSILGGHSKRSKTIPSMLDTTSSSRSQVSASTPDASSTKRGLQHRKRATPEPVMDPERQNGATLARKLARRLKKGRMQLHTNYLKATLGEHRRSEVQQRKEWSAQYREKQAHLDDLGRRLDSEQSAHQASQLQLNRLNGRDLKAMRLSELTSLQDAVEEALQNCRLAIEASSAGT